MNPINVIILVSVLFGASIANAQSLDSLSESYSLTGTGVYVGNYSGTIITLIYSDWSFNIDIDRQLMFMYGDYTIDGIAGNYSHMASLKDGYVWETLNGVCTREWFHSDNVLGGWSSYVATADPRTFTITYNGITSALTLGDDGIPASIVTSATAPFPYIFTVTVTSHTDMAPSFSVFQLPQKCVALGATCTACYSSGMMVASSMLFLMCAVILQFFFHAL